MILCKNVLDLGKAANDVPLQYKEAMLVKGVSYIKEALQLLTAYEEDKKWTPISFIHMTLLAFHENFQDISMSSDDSLTYISVTIDTIQKPKPVEKADSLRREILSCLLFNLISKAKLSSKQYDAEDFTKYCKIVLETFEEIDKNSVRLVLSYFLFARINVFEGKLNVAQEILQFTIQKLEGMISPNDVELSFLTIEPILFYSYVLMKMKHEKQSNDLIQVLLKSLEEKAVKNPYKVVAYLNASRESLASEKFPEIWNIISDFQLRILEQYKEQEIFTIQDLTYQLILKAVNLYHLDRITEAATVVEECETILRSFETRDSFTASRARFQLDILKAYIYDKIARQSINPAIKEARYLDAGKVLFKAWRSTADVNLQLLVMAKIIAIQKKIPQNEGMESIKQIIRSDNEKACIEIEESRELLAYVDTLPEECLFPVWGASVK